MLRLVDVKPLDWSENRNPTVDQVVRAVCEVVGGAGLIDEYFGLSSLADLDNLRHKSWEEASHGFRWVACYAVEGGSEGHYIHVDLVSGADPHTRMGRVRSIITGKTFKGLGHAMMIANYCTVLLSRMF